MTNGDTLSEVRLFFSAVGRAGLILPSGWYGRPYDNLLELTRIEATAQSLFLKFDGQLALTFNGEPCVTFGDGGLKLTRFALLAWDWTEFGSTVTHREVFDSGEVSLVAPMG